MARQVLFLFLVFSVNAIIPVYQEMSSTNASAVVIDISSSRASFVYVDSAKIYYEPIATSGANAVSLGFDSNPEFTNPSSLSCFGHDERCMVCGATGCIMSNMNFGVIKHHLVY
jgi:hypothetical protein